MMACIALFFASCQQEQIVFDHEQQQFATLENAILVELIAPIGTAGDEEIYIIGAFNGMDEKSVIGNVHGSWRKPNSLTRSGAFTSSQVTLWLARPWPTVSAL